MGDEHFTFDIEPDEIFADVEKRTISGIAVPTKETATKGGKTWRFLPGSVTFPERTILLLHHDNTRSVGRLIQSEWEDAGCRTTFKVSKTPEGDSALQLAHDKVLGLSVGVNLTQFGGKKVGTEFHVSHATAPEVSLVSLPAFAGSQVDSVRMSKDKEPVMPDDKKDDVVEPAAPVFDYEKFGAALAGALHPQDDKKDDKKDVEKPEPQPVPPITVREAPLYRFDGNPAEHGFVADIISNVREHDSDAKQRLEKFFSETFVVGADVNELNPDVNRPDMWVAPLRWAARPLGSAVSTGSITDNTPFIFPKFLSTTLAVNEHTEGVEPGADGEFKSTSQTVTPKAFSGKATLTREVIDAGGNPQVDQLVWQEMLNDWNEGLETRLAAMLDAVASTNDVPIVGINKVAVAAANDAIIDLQYEKGGQRFSSFVLASSLYKALANAVDDDGRPLIPALTPINAQGLREVGFGSLAIGGFRGVPAYALGEHDSFMLVRGSVYQWASAARKLTMDNVGVANVYLGIWGYEAHAITRTADVRRWTYSAT
jgi:HK97 family phage prohead protease